jgi:hypothetical protein
MVQISKIQGEYVAYGWINITDDHSAAGGIPSILQVEWDPYLPQYTLRWKTN